MLGAEDGDPDVAERHAANSALHLVVERVIGEEEVDRIVPPPEADLAIAHKGRVVGRDVDADLLQRRPDIRPAIGGDKDVDIDVRGGTWLRVVDEGEGPPDRVGHFGHGQRSVDRDYLVGQRDAAAPRSCGERRH